MKNSIVGRAQQAEKLRMLFASILTAVVIVLSFINPIISAYHENVFVEGIHIDLLIQGLQSDAFSSFLPILSIASFGGSYVDDIKSKFAHFFLIRSSYRKFLFSHVVVGFLAGSLVIFFGILIAWGITAVTFIPVERRIEGIEPPTIGGLIEICVLSLIDGGLWSIVGMAMSTVIESKYIAYASPFVIYYLLVILCERYFPAAYILYPPNWIKPDGWPHGAWGAVIYLMELTFVFALLFLIRGERRLREL